MIFSLAALVLASSNPNPAFLWTPTRAAAENMKLATLDGQILDERLVEDGIPLAATAAGISDDALNACRTGACGASFSIHPGATGIIFSSLEKDGHRWSFQVLVRDRTGREIAHQRVTSASELESAQQARNAAQAIVDQILRHFQQPIRSRAIRTLAPWAVTGGAVIAALGGGFLYLAKQNYNDIRSYTTGSDSIAARTASDVFATARTGQREKDWGSILVGAGFAGMITGAVFYLVSRRPKTTAWMAGVNPETHSVVLAGVFP